MTPRQIAADDEQARRLAEGVVVAALVDEETLALMERLAEEQDTTPGRLASEWIERAAHEARVGMARDLALRVTCPVRTCKAAAGAPCARGKRHGNAAVKGPHLRRITSAREVARHATIGGEW